MANKSQTDDEILAEMNKIDELELQGGSNQKKVDPALLAKDE